MPEVIVHQGNASGVGGDVGAGEPHGDTNISGGQDRSIVDAIAHNQGAMTFVLEIQQLCMLLFRQALGLDGVDPHGTADPLCNREAVSSEHGDSADAKATHPLE